jgi:hypothetical protein
LTDSILRRSSWLRHLRVLQEIFKGPAESKDGQEDSSLPSMPGPSSILKSLVNMRLLSIAVACLLAFSLSTSASPILEIVDQATYEPLMLFTKWLGGLDGINRTMSNNLVLYTKYSPAVYQQICACPLDNILMTLVCFFSVWFKTTLSLVLLVWECWYARCRCAQ